MLPPTADYDGFGVKCCQVCNDIMEIEPLTWDNCCSEHTYSDWNAEYAADCVNGGTSTRYCTVCGVMEYEFTPALGHTYGTWETTCEPSCTQQGEEKATCSICGLEVSRSLAALGHTEGPWVITTPATPDAEGEKTQYCAVCQEIIRTEPVSKVPQLAIHGASLTLYNDLTINFKVDEMLFAQTGYEAPYVIFRFNGREIKTSNYRIADGKYVFDFNKICPHQMGDVISVTLHAVYNGVEYASEALEYSVAAYCFNMLSKYTDETYGELRTLLVDLLNYGAASQKYVNYRTNMLVNAELTDEQKACGTNTDRALETVLDVGYEMVKNPAVRWIGAGLNLQKSVGMRFKISAADIENLTVKVRTESGKETIITSDTFEATTGGYYVFYEGQNAAQMSEAVYLTVYDGEKVVSHTICYSIESYAYTKQSSADTKLVALVKAMMKYGDAAKAYSN